MAKFILDKIHSDDWPQGVIRLQENLQRQSDELQRIAEEHKKAETEAMRQQLQEEFDEKYKQMAEELAKKHPANPWAKAVEMGIEALTRAIEPTMQMIENLARMTHQNFLR